MPRVKFLVQYEILQDNRKEYVNAIAELQNLLKAEGLESYSVFEIKGKPNHFQEQYIFSSEESFENFDDNNDERISILINKISEMTVEHSTKYTTLIELN
jgi:hypothetical protein